MSRINSTLDRGSLFGYDKRDQLTLGDHAAPRVDEGYTYDSNGNRTGGGYVNTANNQTTADVTYTYLYDKEGNRTRRTKVSDGSYEEYSWDHRNRLSKVSFKTSAGVETKSVTYSYDIFNRLIRRQHDADGSGPGVATNLFLVGYDGINPTLAFDGTATSDVSNRYLWGPAIDQLLADEQVSVPTSAGNVIWPLADHLGTIRDLVDFIESTLVFTVTNHRVFDSFGKLTSETNPTVDESFAYTGKFFDEVTQLSNHWNRWYDPKLGKWLSEDPIGFWGGDANLARYVINNAVNYIDQTGLSYRDDTWVWPWDSNSDWSPGSTATLWWNKSTYYGGAVVCGLAQGGCNIANGLQDSAIGLANLPAGYINSIAWAEEKLGIIVAEDSIRVPYIPSPDWSRDLITTEAGQEGTWSDSHWWSKAFGAAGVEAWIGAKGIGKFSKLKPPGVPSQTLSKAERLTEFNKRLVNSPGAKSADEALDQISNTLDEVEDAFSGKPKSKNPGLEYDGRMYPPEADNIVRLKDGSIRVRTKGNRINIGADGSIQITDLDGNVIVTKQGG